MVILQEGPEPLPRCDQRGMNMSEDILLKNIYMERCNKATDMRIRWRDVDMEERCREMNLSLYRG